MRSKTVLKVGMKMPIKLDNHASIPLYKTVHDCVEVQKPRRSFSYAASYLCEGEQKVEVLDIAVLGAHGSSVPILVRSLKNPEKFGWIMFNMGTPPAGTRYKRMVTYTLERVIRPDAP